MQTRDYPQFGETKVNNDSLGHRNIQLQARKIVLGEMSLLEKAGETATLRWLVGPIA